MDSSIGDFCSKAAGMMQFVGYALLIFRIAIPLIIVIMGMIDLGKAVTASKDDEIKKATKQLGIRLAAGLLIYFIPALVVWIFGLVAEFSSSSDDIGFSTCEGCLLHPTDSAKCNPSSN